MYKISVLWNLVAALGLMSGTLLCGEARSSTPLTDSYAKVTEGLRLVLSPSAVTAKDFQPLRAKLVLRNTTDREVGNLNIIGTACATFDFVATNEKGEQMPSTQLATSERHPNLSNPQFGFSIGGLNAEQTATYLVDLNGVCDLTVPGTYSVKAMLRVPKLDGSGTTMLESNTIMVTVLSNPEAFSSPAYSDQN